MCGDPVCIGMGMLGNGSQYGNAGSGHPQTHGAQLLLGVEVILASLLHDPKYAPFLE